MINKICVSLALVLASTQIVHAEDYDKSKLPMDARIKLEDSESQARDEMEKERQSGTAPRYYDETDRERDYKNRVDQNFKERLDRSSAAPSATMRSGSESESDSSSRWNVDSKPMKKTTTKSMNIYSSKEEAGSLEDSYSCGKIPKGLKMQVVTHFFAYSQNIFNPGELHVYEIKVTDQIRGLANKNCKKLETVFVSFWVDPF